MITNTRQKILAYIRENGKARVHDLVNYLHISQVAIHRQLKKLVEAGELQKAGKPPLVFYFISRKKQAVDLQVPEQIKKEIDQDYLYVSPTGEMVNGFAGFSRWVKEIKQAKYLLPLAREYVATRKKANLLRSDHGWIDATKKYNETFPEKSVDKVLYQDFYALPKFGKTRLGQLMLHAKQSQDRKLITLLAKESQALIQKIIKHFSIEAAAFIPPSIPRKLQFQKVFQNTLALQLPYIDLVKVYAGDVIVAQKTLSSLSERITNARETIFTKQEKGNYKNILIIDDAVGSGATMHETGRKLKAASFASGSLIAFALVGSFKGFDVIREV